MVNTSSVVMVVGRLISLTSMPTDAPEVVLENHEAWEEPNSSNRRSAVGWVCPTAASPTVMTVSDGERPRRVNTSAATSLV